MATIAAADAQLGLDLFSAAAGEDNLMLSPYSIATALSMLYPGARNLTADEMAAVLHVALDDAQLHAARNALDQQLTAAPEVPGEEGTPEPFAIRPANSAWGQGGYEFDEQYLETLAANYAAGLRLTDFAGDPEGSRQTINDWVAAATEDRIEDLIPAGGVNSDTRLALVNAIWFKASWLEQFDPQLTAPGDFTRADGTTVTAPLMHGSQRTGYAATDDYEALRLPYAGDAAMVVMLPREGTPAELAASLTAEDLDVAWGDFEVEITLPTFEFESEMGLREALTTLGMEQAFVPPTGDSGADFTGITPVRELFVQDVFHKSFIALDEQGTEAAAATAVVVGVTSLPQPATFTADRPFLFWIEHSPSGELLFLGQVTDPTAA